MKINNFRDDHTDNSALKYHWTTFLTSGGTVNLFLNVVLQSVFHWYTAICFVLVCMVWTGECTFREKIPSEHDQPGSSFGAWYACIVEEILSECTSASDSFQGIYHLHSPGKFMIRHDVCRINKRFNEILKSKSLDSAVGSVIPVSMLGILLNVFFFFVLWLIVHGHTTISWLFMYVITLWEVPSEGNKISSTVRGRGSPIPTRGTSVTAILSLPSHMRTSCSTSCRRLEETRLLWRLNFSAFRVHTPCRRSTYVTHSWNNSWFLSIKSSPITFLTCSFALLTQGIRLLLTFKTTHV